VPGLSITPTWTRPPSISPTLMRTHSNSHLSLSLLDVHTSHNFSTRPSPQIFPHSTPRTHTHTTTTRTHARTHADDAASSTRHPRTLNDDLHARTHARTQTTCRHSTQRHTQITTTCTGRRRQRARTQAEQRQWPHCLPLLRLPVVLAFDFVMSEF
jgi:hypothetical protein